MICEYCGGLVEWKGPFSNLTHTECLDCRGRNCQIPEPYEEEEEEEEEEQEPTLSAPSGEPAPKQYE